MAGLLRRYRRCAQIDAACSIATAGSSVAPHRQQCQRDRGLDRRQRRFRAGIPVPDRGERRSGVSLAGGCGRRPSTAGRSNLLPAGFAGPRPRPTAGFSGTRSASPPPPFSTSSRRRPIRSATPRCTSIYGGWNTPSTPNGASAGLSSRATPSTRTARRRVKQPGPATRVGYRSESRSRPPAVRASRRRPPRARSHRNDVHEIDGVGVCMPGAPPAAPIHPACPATSRETR